MNADELKTILNQELAVFFGQVTRYFDERIKGLKSDIDGLDQRFDRLQTTVDGMVKRLDDGDIERAAMQHQLSRHDAWIHRLADHTKLELNRGS